MTPISGTCSLAAQPVTGIAMLALVLSSRTAIMTHHVSRWQRMTEDDMAKALEPWVTSEEICKYLRISANTLTRWIADRGMPGQRVGRSLRFKVSEVDAWIRRTPAADDKERS